MNFKGWLGDSELDSISCDRTTQDRHLVGRPTPRFGSGWRGIRMEAPPSNSDRETLSDLRLMQGVRSSLGKDRKREVREQDRGDLEALFVDLLRGLGEDVPKSLRREITAVSSELATIGLHFKDEFKRARPWQLLKAVGGESWDRGRTTGSPSYPSNHALIGTFMAIWLSRLYPGRAKALESLGRRLGDNRHAAGYHFKGDVDAGNQLARRLWKFFKAKPGGRQDGRREP